MVLICRALHGEGARRPALAKMGKARMSKRDRDTAMGGTRKEFPKTPWTEIRDAKTHDEAKQRAIVDNLVNEYWKPVYCYLRRIGYANEPAKDLTQGFYNEIVLGRDLIRHADQSKGRFRTFLLTALKRYVVSAHRHETAKIRMPKDGIGRMEATEMQNLAAERSEVKPEDVFYHAWAANLLDQVIGEIKDEYYKSGKAAHWEVFRERLLSPIFTNVKAASLKEICMMYGVESEEQVSNMIVTVKRRFHSILKRHLRQFVRSDLEVEDEFNDLLKVLSKSGAR